MATLKKKPHRVYHLYVRVPEGTDRLKRSRVGLDTKDKDSAEAQRCNWLAVGHT